MFKSAHLWAILAVILLAGCVTDPIEVDPVQVENETTIDYLSDTSNLEPEENPHGLTVVNSGDATTEIRLHIVRDASEEVVFEQSYILAPEAKLTGVLEYEANYTVTVERGTVTEVVHLPRSTFDCNSSGTTFTVSETDITSGTVSTMAYCPEDPPGDT